MIYILNPGPGLDVVTFTKREAAEAAHIATDTASDLYSFDGRRLWRQFSCQGSWYPKDRTALPVKVLDAAKS